MGAQRGEGQGRGQVGADARGPAESEDDADQEGAEHATAAESLGQLKPLGAFEQADPDHADDREPEQDDRGAADDLHDPPSSPPRWRPAQCPPR